MKWDDIRRSPYSTEEELASARTAADAARARQLETRIAERAAKGWPEGAYSQDMADLMNCQAAEQAALKAELDGTRQARAWNAATKEYLASSPVPPRQEAN